jgi:hypothetical protein
MDANGENYSKANVENQGNNYVSIICLSFVVVVFTMDFNNFPLIHRDNPYSHTS